MSALTEIVRRWISARDDVVSRDRVATSVFAAPGARRPSHDKFLNPLNACADMLQRELPQWSPMEWAAFAELVNTVNARVIADAVRSGDITVNRNKLVLATRIDPDDPSTWDDDLSSFVAGETTDLARNPHGNDS